MKIKRIFIVNFNKIKVIIVDKSFAKIVINKFIIKERD